MTPTGLNTVVETAQKLGCSRAQVFRQGIEMNHSQTISQFAGTPAKRLVESAAASAAKQHGNEVGPHSRTSPEPQGLGGQRVLSACGDNRESAASPDRSRCFPVGSRGELNGSRDHEARARRGQSAVETVLCPFSNATNEQRIRALGYLVGRLGALAGSGNQDAIDALDGAREAAGIPRPCSWCGPVAPGFSSGICERHHAEWMAKAQQEVAA